MPISRETSAAAGTIVSWGGDLAGSTDSDQRVSSLTPAGDVVAVPTAALAFGAANVADGGGTLRFGPTATPLVRRNAALSANIPALTFTAADGITLGGSATGPIIHQGSRVSFTIVATERAAVDANGLSTPNAVTIGSPAASSGSLRGTVSFALNVRNNTDTGNCALLSYDAGHVLTIAPSGVSFIQVTNSQLWFTWTVSAPTFGHYPQQINALPTTLKIRSQAPHATATGANRTPGILQLEVPAAVGGGAESYVNVLIAATDHARIDGTIADTETSLLLRRNVGGAFSLQRVSMGAADSGGAGFKLLRVAN